MNTLTITLLPGTETTIDGYPRTGRIFKVFIQVVGVLLSWNGYVIELGHYSTLFLNNPKWFLNMFRKRRHNWE